MGNSALLLELIMCLAILCAFVVYPWIRQIASVGLPVCYILSLAMIHWLGGLIHALPFEWHSEPDPFTPIGFEQAFLASIGCAVGSFFVAPFLLRMLFRGEAANVRAPSADQTRLGYLYLLLGLIFFGVLAPFMRGLPSISAVAVCGVYLAIVGMCLLCWNSLIRRKYVELLGCLLGVCIIPFVTMITLGYVAYGVGASLIVLIFIATHYQPRWHAVITLSVLCYLGLSLFVTYSRDRDDLRKTVWGGAAYNERVEKASTIITNFEFIDLSNPRHLRRIDNRLNQNYLVGRVVRTIELGQERFAYGGTLYEAMLSLVPRILWPEKPVEAGSGNTVSRYARMKFAANTSIGIGQVMEFYINFGSLGVVLGFLVMGVVIRLVDARAAFHLYEGDWRGFMQWLLPSISLLNLQGSFVEVVGTAAASLVLVILVNKLQSSTLPVSDGPSVTMRPGPAYERLAR
jgi:hypothetical protein